MRKPNDEEAPVIDEPTFVEGSDNIYADLGFDDPEMELTRDRLARRLGREIQARGLNQGAAAVLLETDEATVFAILAGDLSDVSVSALMTFLTRIGQDVKIIVLPTSSEHTTGRIEVEAELTVAAQSAVRPPST